MPLAQLIADQMNILTQAPIAVAFLDTNLNYVAHSKKWCEDYNLGNINLKGRNHYDIFPEIPKAWRDKHQRILQGKEESKDRELFVREDGSHMYLKWSIKPWKGIKEEIIGVIMYSEDITKEVEQSEKQQRSRKLLLDACDRARIGAWEFNNITQDLYWSRVTKEIHEVDMDYMPIASEALNFYMDGDSKDSITVAFEECMSYGKDFDLELQLVTALGNTVWVRSFGSSVFENDKCVSIYGTFEDITLKKIREREAAIQSHKFEKLFNKSMLGIIILDATSFMIHDINDSGKELLALDDSLNHDLNLENLIIQEDLIKFYQSVKDLLNHKKSTLKHYIRFHTQKGDIKLTETTCTILHGDIELENQLVLQINDISELRKTRKESKKFVNQIMQKNERLTNFAHIVSHNLRSHSSNFKGLIDFHKESDDEESRASIMKMLESSSNQLSQTILDLNSIVTMQTDRLQLQPIVLKTFIENQLLPAHLRMPGDDFQVDINIPDHIIVNAFPAYLESILINLFTNSLKYRKADVKLCISITACEEKDQCQITYTDNGIGIDLQANGDKVFGMYKTFHEHNDSKGLGLFITKNQVEAMGGDITIDSTVNKGTSFTITL